MQPSVYAPSMASVLRLPTHVLVVRVCGMAALAVGANIAIRWSVRCYEMRTKTFIPGTNRHPRCGPSLWLNMCVTGGAAVALQAVYRSVRLLPMAMEAVVKGLRMCAGMDATAPYGEMVGGSALMDVAAAVDTVCRAMRIPYVPQLSIFGINPHPMTATEHAELFGGGAEGLQRFHTPARFLSMAVLGVGAFGVSRLIRNALLLRLAPSAVPPRPKWHTGALLLAAPAAVFQVLAVVGDDEAVWGVPVSTLFVGLFAANAYAIKAYMTSQRVDLPPSQADLDIQVAVTEDFAKLRLNYAEESGMKKMIGQLFVLCVRHDLITRLPGLVAMSALTECLMSDIGPEAYLKEFGITTTGALGDLWGDNSGGDSPDRVCTVCRGRHASTTTIAVPFAQMPCCNKFMHMSCAIYLLKEGRRTCALCNVPHHRVMNEEDREFIQKYAALSPAKREHVVSRFASDARTNIGIIFGFIRRSSPSPLPYACLTVEDVFAFITDHPSPTSLTQQAASSICVFLTSPISVQLAYLLTIVMCPTGVENPLFPATLHDTQKAQVLYSESRTLLDKCIAKVGGLLHFNIVS